MSQEQPPTKMYGPWDRNAPRWYDPNRVTMVLFSIIGFLVVGWGGWIFTMVRASEAKNIEQDQKIQTLEKMFEKIDRKLDEVLREAKK